MNLFKKMIAALPFQRLYGLGYRAAREYLRWYSRLYPQSEAKAAETLLTDYGLGLSIERKASIDCNGRALPWYTLPAIEFLKTLDYKDKNIYEFGCGNSSLFWSQRANSVTGVEDNAQWYEFCRRNSPDNVTLSLQPEKSGYVNHIRETQRQYDVIVIDGKWRYECCQSAITSLAADGCIILDNSDRAQEYIEYQNAIEFLNHQQLLQVDFTGFSTGASFVTTTSVFFRRNFNFAAAGPFRPLKSIGHIFECSPRFAAVRLELLQQHAPLKITVGAPERPGYLPLDRSFFRLQIAADWEALFEKASIYEITINEDIAGLTDSELATVAGQCYSYLHKNGRLQIALDINLTCDDKNRLYQCLKDCGFDLDTAQPDLICAGKSLPMKEKQS